MNQAYRDHISASVALIREAAVEDLLSEYWLQHSLLPRLGFPEGARVALPEMLHDRVDTGLKLMQAPNQFAPYLLFLSQKNIRSYVELGVFSGGTFIVTIEYLKR